MPSRSFQAPQRSHGLQASQLSDVAFSKPAKSSPLVHSYSHPVETVERRMSVPASVPTGERPASESPLVERKKKKKKKDNTSPEQKTRHQSTPLKEEKKVEEETHKQRKKRKRLERAMSTPLKEGKKEKGSREQRTKRKREERAMSTPLDGVKEKTKKSPAMQMEQTFTLPNSEWGKSFHREPMRGLEEDSEGAGKGKEKQIAVHD